MVSRELEKECIVVFDEAHNIDNVCIEVSLYGVYSPDRVYHGVKNKSYMAWSITCI